MPIEEAAAFCRQLADVSGEIIRSYYRTSYTVHAKQDESPVTVADREAELAMRRLIGQNYPTHGVLGEEFGSYQPDADYQWVLDPIDGTKNFISHGFLFGTLIALLHKGRPIVGAIHHPVTGDFMIGDGSQARLNNQPVHVRPCLRIEDATLLASDHWTAGEYQNSNGFEQLARRVRQYKTWGDCHGYFLVACGGADIMCDPIMSPWDLMALIPVIEGAGGCITSWTGGDAATGSSAVATAGQIHDEVIRALNG
jgi:myo-inositol-1(or 4)-monophosphatase